MGEVAHLRLSFPSCHISDFFLIFGEMQLFTTVKTTLTPPSPPPLPPPPLFPPPPLLFPPPPPPPPPHVSKRLYWAGESFQAL